ncbi:MAG: succinate dehydrogenase assembly factor 2 [Pseudomonadota bacterium]
MSSISIESRKRRAIFRAEHRGMREMDIILGRYAKDKVPFMSDNELLEFEMLMEILDRDLFKWFTGEGTVPDNHDTPLFRAICDFHGIERA